MSCDEMETLLHGYLDGELDALTNSRIEAHLATCASCSQELESFRDLRTQLRRPDLYYSAPVPAIARVRGAVRRVRDESGARRGFGWRAPLAAAASLAAVLLLVLIVGRVRTTGSGDDLLLRDAVDGHVRSLMADHLVDIRSSDKHTVKPWFDGKLDFAPPVERLDGTAFPLEGGRLDYIAGHQAAAVVYRHNKHYINLFIWPVSGPDAPVKTSTDRGYNLVHWTQQGMAYWAISDVSASDLEAFAELIGKSHK